MRDRMLMAMARATSDMSEAEIDGLCEYYTSSDGVKIPDHAENEIVRRCDQAHPNIEKKRYDQVDHDEEDNEDDENNDEEDQKDSEDDYNGKDDETGH